MNDLQQKQEREDNKGETSLLESSDPIITQNDEQTTTIQPYENNSSTEDLLKQNSGFESDNSLPEIEPESAANQTTEEQDINLQYSEPDIVITESELSSGYNKTFTEQDCEQDAAHRDTVMDDNDQETEKKSNQNDFGEIFAEEELETHSSTYFEDVSAGADKEQVDKDTAPVQTPGETPSPTD